MTQRINLKATLEMTNRRITKTFLARSLGRSFATINNWCNDSKIPEAAHKRLLEILEANGVNIIWHKSIN